jgi:hypothetical protein
MFNLLLVVCSFLWLTVTTQAQESLPAFHTRHMLRSHIKITQPAKDIVKRQTSLVTVIPGEIEVNAIRNTYPFIEITGKVLPSIAYNTLEITEKTSELSPTNTTSGEATKFIKGIIYNNTKDTLSILTYIGQTIFGIQEAMNEKGIWQPIEYMVNDRCGNSGDDLYLAPQNFVKFYIPRYYGNFKTRMRLRLILIDGVTFSNEWEGSIDKQQFEKPKEAYDNVLKNFYDFLIRPFPSAP